MLFLSVIALASAEVTFYAMGDVPYAEEEFARLSSQLVGTKGVAFAVHVGDIKRGSQPCTAGYYKRVATTLARSPVPLFITVGDNEWNDCDDPAAAWKLWEETFLSFHARFEPPFAVTTDSGRKESWAFEKDGVVFVGVSVVGGKMLDRKETKSRGEDNLSFVEARLEAHADARALVVIGHARPSSDNLTFFAGLSKVARGFGKPVLYLHGDGHDFEHEEHFRADNLVRVQVERGGKEDPLRVTVADDGSFKLERGTRY